MAVLTWDQIGERFYETGVDHGVIYVPDETGVYDTGFAWNGLTAVTESPSGAESTGMYADNIKYINLISAEEFNFTIEAFTWPDEFNQFDGNGVDIAVPGLVVGQQSRGSFGFSYRTRKGNDLDLDDHGYKLHLVYGCQAAPSEKAYNTVNDSPEAITFSWEVSTTPAPMTGFRPTALLVVDSTTADPTKLAALEVILYGAVATEPKLPTPDEVKTLLTP